MNVVLVFLIYTTSSTLESVNVVPMTYGVQSSYMLLLYSSVIASGEPTAFRLIVEFAYNALNSTPVYAFSIWLAYVLQFVAAFQSEYNAFGTIILNVELVLPNVFVLNGGIAVASEKYTFSRAVQPWNI